MVGIKLTFNSLIKAGIVILNALKPHTYARILYQGQAGRKTPSHRLLNTHLSSVRNNTNVRKSAASHEFGHVIGLDDRTSGKSIINTSRNRNTLIEGIATDIANVNRRLMNRGTIEQD
ncbi:hypothetical protein AN965_02950 [Alkalicoccobacillus plakortidis]|uniref:Peptidase M10 metallopeptidase domain-containing protein n=1 Tax=Alkalicoccobacillus plakortidis TaxID=444060 RepID=A0A9D5DTL4_9BACI|nr:hypothetical protein [Alkalicoccobacillus plakortidis]KQL58540.1 hypothetical protein AN965_02950 [Alkalicoccobacillus plakortidis]